MDLRESNIVGRQTRELIVGPQMCPSLSLYGVGLTGLSHVSGEFCFARRQPRLSQLLACVSGWGWVWVGGEWARCGPGTAYVTPPGVAHAYRAAEGVRWRIAWVIYTNQWRDGPALGPDRPVLLGMDPRPLAASIEGLYREAIGTAEPAVMHHWAHLIHTYAQRVVDPEGGSDSRLRALWEAVDTHLAHPWTVTELAARAGTSGEHLRRLCRRLLGRSPMRHVTDLRMRRAAALLSSESYTVEAVAQQVGYENAFAFSTAFKRRTGLSPSEYRGTRRDHPV